MDFPALATQLAELGGFTLFLALGLAVLVGLFRKWWIPNWVHAAVEKRLIEAEAEVKRLTRSVARLTLALARERRRRRTDTRPDA